MSAAGKSRGLRDRHESPLRTADVKVERDQNQSRVLGINLGSCGL